MRPFNRHLPCPKCGGKFVRSYYEKDPLGRESINRVCTGCGYVWHEATLDYQQAPTPPITETEQLLVERGLAKFKRGVLPDDAEAAALARAMADGRV